MEWNVRVDGWTGFYGILSMQIAELYHAYKLYILVRPMACIKEIIHLG